MGELQFERMLHNGMAINCIHINYADPTAWKMVQFFSDQQMNDYANEHGLIIVKKEPST